MKRLLLSAAAAFVLSPVAGAVEIEIAYSEAFQEKLEEDLGLREGERLAEEIREDLMRELDNRDLDPARVVVTIVDAKPNRPTFKQLGDRPGLDFTRSVSLGGMDLTAQAFDAEGEVLSEIEYDYFERNLDQVVGFSTWTDARRASDRFARRFARQLEG